MNYCDSCLIFSLGAMTIVAIPTLMYFCALIKQNNAMLKELLAKGSKKQEVMKILEKHKRGSVKRE